VAKKTLLSYASQAEWDYAVAHPDRYNKPTFPRPAAGAAPAKRVLASWATEADKAFAAAHPDRYEVAGVAAATPGIGERVMPSLATRSSAGTFSPESAALALRRRATPTPTRTPTPTPSSAAPTTPKGSIPEWLAEAIRFLAKGFEGAGTSFLSGGIQPDTSPLSSRVPRPRRPRPVSWTGGY